jgi:uncharacterized SAM-binding protein YcdF (DUF218 family)
MTTRLRRARCLGLAIAAAAIIGLLGWISRETLLGGAGAFLLRQDAPSAADVIVVVRGDEVRFDRALKAAELFNAGLAPLVYVSSALDDLAAAALQARGISTASGQDKVVGVLVQRGVPCGRIAVDTGLPGGGTAGEMRRVGAFAKSRGIASAILVTSWFHSRRLRLVAETTLPDVRVRIVAADAQAAEHNWWRRRYLALTVAEEYLKLLSYKLGIAASFADDPRAGGTATYLEPPSRCDVARRDGRERPSAANPKFGTLAP